MPVPDFLDKIANAFSSSMTKVEKTNVAGCETKITEQHAISGGKGTQTTNMCVNTQGVATSIEVINRTDNSKTKSGPMGLVSGAIANSNIGPSTDFHTILKNNNPLKELAGKMGVQLPEDQSTIAVSSIPNRTTGTGQAMLGSRG